MDFVESMRDIIDTSDEHVTLVRALFDALDWAWGKIPTRGANSARVNSEK